VAPEITTDPVNTTEDDATEADTVPDGQGTAVDQPPLPVLKVALPAAASVTRPIRPSTVAGAPPLRRKQQ
jgi:hypothetical protein